MGAVLSFGQDPRWRRAMVRAVAAAPDDRVLDVATARGWSPPSWSAATGARWSGSTRATRCCRARAPRLASDPDLAARVTLVEGEAEWLPFADGEFDALTFTYLLRYVDDPAAHDARAGPRGEAGRARSRRSSSACRRGAWRARCGWRTPGVGLPALGRLVSRDWYEVGRFLGPSISGFYRAPPGGAGASHCGAARASTPSASGG